MKEVCLTWLLFYCYNYLYHVNPMNNNLETTVHDMLEMIRFIHDNALTRDDLVNMATKDDLLGLATKDDIANMATKDDIAAIRREMATKDDLAKLEKELRKDIRELRNDMTNHVNRFVVLHEKHDVELAAVASRQERIEENHSRLADTVKMILKHIGLELA